MGSKTTSNNNRNIILTRIVFKENDFNPLKPSCLIFLNSVMGLSMEISI